MCWGTGLSSCELTPLGFLLVCGLIQARDLLLWVPDLISFL